MDIKILLGRTVDKITEVSKTVMTTMGEWELLDITAHQYNIAVENENSSIDELSFHVC